MGYLGLGLGLGLLFLAILLVAVLVNAKQTNSLCWADTYHVKNTEQSDPLNPNSFEISTLDDSNKPIVKKKEILETAIVLQSLGEQSEHKHREVRPSLV